MEPDAPTGPQRLAALPAGPVAFAPAGGRLVAAAGDQLRLLDADGALVEAWTAGPGVRALAFGPDGALWVLRSGAVARLVDGAVACEAPVTAERILTTDATGITLSAETWLELGVFGQIVHVDAQCATAESELSQPPTSAIAAGPSGAWRGTAALTGPGPSRQGPPTLAHGDGAAWPVFADDDAAARVDAIAVGASGALIQSETGAWELWSTDGARIAAGKAAPGLAAVPGADAAWVGADQVDLSTGSVTAGALPAPIVAASPDGTRLALGPAADRALWSR